MRMYVVIAGVLFALGVRLEAVRFVALAVVLRFVADGIEKELHEPPILPVLVRNDDITAAERLPRA